MAPHSIKCPSLDLHHLLLFKDPLRSNNLLSRVATLKAQRQTVMVLNHLNPPRLQAQGKVACLTVDQAAQPRLN
jgi:hypothetical protein